MTDDEPAAKYVERRRQPRYPVAAGFLEFAGRILEVENVSENGLCFRTAADLPLDVGETHDAFLVLQAGENQFEIPVVFEVRRRDGEYIGAQTTYRAEYHHDTVREFIRTSGHDLT